MGSFVHSLIHETSLSHCIVIKATKMGGSKVTLAAEWRKYCGARQEWNQKGYLGVVK